VAVLAVAILVAYVTVTRGDIQRPAEATGGGT
jgi:hypothetical protein